VLADNLSGEPFETAQLRHDREMEDAMVDDQEEPDRDDEQRRKRREVMKLVAEAARNALKADAYADIEDLVAPAP
jgi:hypothetical protein